ncbi:hypothetical protein BASA81_001035 [Batrachochytrium salamandrivorans]|nr:hypothetical protein BASA81_001035 [Batrachochytrium salamandrivorans]
MPAAAVGEEEREGEEEMKDEEVDLQVFGTAVRELRQAKDLPQAITRAVQYFDRNQTAVCDELCRELVGLLRDSAGMDSVLAESACWGIQRVAQNNARLQLLLGGMGACGLVVDCLEFFANNHKVVEQALLAMGHLSSRNQMNKKRFEEYGACQVLVALVLKRPGNLLEWAVCFAVANLALGEPSIVKKLRANQMTMEIIQRFACPLPDQLEWKHKALECLT